MSLQDRVLTQIAAATAANAATPPQKIGVLLANLGTPDRADHHAVRRYLREFLSDRRVIEVPRPAWFFILNALILPFRPFAKARDYRSIWNLERDESPLKTITRSQADKLQAALGRDTFGDPGEIVVAWGMRYGSPSLAEAVAQLTAAGCDRVLLVPLYPQYAAATTATACDAVFAALSRLRNQPTLRVAAPYWQDPVYIDEVARSIERGLARSGFEPEVILASFHGVPAACAASGDPYHDQCMRTGEALRRRLGLPVDRFLVTFQSRFGRAEWLRPYTDATVKALAISGVKRIAVVNPGFAADCLETIEEIGRENAEYFQLEGGEGFVRIACLNDEAGGMRVIENVVRRELQGWVQAESEGSCTGRVEGVSLMAKRA